jgi:hypothetical protein
MSKKSPFPGMNPWLEEFCGDVHTRLTTYASDQLQTGLPAGLRAQVEEYVTVQSPLEEGDWRHQFVPDVMVTDSRPSKNLLTESAVATLEAPEAILLKRTKEPITLRNIVILDTKSGNRVITAIEFLSPSNKIGRGRENFLTKQEMFYDGGVNLVEIDLIRDGEWSVTIPQDLIPPSQQTPYRAVVVRGDVKNRCWYYPITISSPMPKLSIPLRSGEPDILLDLQALLDLAYVNGGYQGAIDYTKPLRNPLPPEITAWIETWLKANANKDSNS